MEKLTAVPIVWPYPCLEVSVLGDFDDFLLHEMTGETEKVTVLWLPAGLFTYRFLVDGSYVCDPLKPMVKVDDLWYNKLVVEDVPDALASLSSLTLAEIEGLDRELFPLCTSQSSHNSSIASLDSELPVIDRIPQLSPPFNIGLSQRYTEICAANTIKAWFIRLKVSVIQFLRLKRSAVIIEKHIRRWLCERRFHPIKRCFAELKSRKSARKSESKMAQTDMNSRLMNEIVASWARLSAENKRLTEENGGLMKELALVKHSTKSASVSLVSDSDLSLKLERKNVVARHRK